MKVMIGVDPHKGSHTATMLDRTERELARIKVRAGRDQLGELLEWADGVSPRTRAVESAGGMAICSPSNWSPLARRCSTCRRCWPHGSGCSALVSPPRPIRTRPARSLSPRCMLRRSPWCAGLTCDGVPAAGQAPHRRGSLANQAVLPATRLGRRANARWDRQRSSRQPGTITARELAAGQRGRPSSGTVRPSSSSPTSNTSMPCLRTRGSGSAPPWQHHRRR